MELFAAPDCLRGFFLQRRRVDLQLSLQCVTKSGQVPIAHHLAQARLDVQERSGQPAMALTRVLPVIDLRAALLNERVDGLEAVRRLQRPAQHAVHPEAMQRQGLVEAFRQTAGRRLVPILQLMLERLEGGEGLVVLGRL